MKIIATGWREYADPVLPGRALDFLLLVAWSAGEKLTVVHGDGRGLDQLVRQWAVKRKAEQRDVEQIPVPANWAVFGRRAGLLRNEKMWLENYYDTDLCLGFPGIGGLSTGTPHCIGLARQYECPVWEFPWGTDWTPPPEARLIPAGGVTDS